MTTFVFDGTLEVTIADAKLQIPSNLRKQDSFCVVTLGSSGLKSLLEGERFGKEKFQTRVSSGAHPAWDEIHNVSLKNMKLDSQLKVKIYDKDKIMNHFLGETALTLEDLLKYDRGEVHYFPIYKKAGADVGQIGVAVTFNCPEMPQTHLDIKNGTATSSGRYSATDLCSTKGQVEQGHPVPHPVQPDIESSKNLISKGQVEQGHPLPSTNMGSGSQYGQLSNVCSKGQIEQGHPIPHNIGASDDMTDQERTRTSSF